MARIIRIDEIEDYVKGQIDKLLTVTVLETDKRCKLESPVDTGRFRASWQVGQNSATGEGATPGSYGSIPAIQKTNYQEEKAGNIYSIFNNLPYAERLANGYSKQANPGWLQGIAKDMQSWVNSQADRIGRES